MPLVRIPFAAPAEAVFDYLAEPSNRPQWQSSLRKVDRLHGEGLGQSWRDRTWPGLAPMMCVTAYDRPKLWAETGTWRGVTAELVLTFAEEGPGCVVVAEFSLSGKGVWRPVVAAANATAGPAIAADLRRAARIVAGSTIDGEEPPG